MCAASRDPSPGPDLANSSNETVRRLVAFDTEYERCRLQDVHHVWSMNCAGYVRCADTIANIPGWEDCLLHFNMAMELLRPMALKRSLNVFASKRDSGARNWR